MKRTNLVLDEDLLEEATRLSGERTYSRTVERALEEFVRRAKARRILDFGDRDSGKGTSPSSVRTAACIGRDGVVLVDTSVWIEVFRKPSRLRLETALDFDDVVTCLPVVQEVLQGFRDEMAFVRAREAMQAIPALESPLRHEVFLEAAELYRSARRAGLTVRSGVDCLIAACALRHGAEVFHHDRDYDALAKVSPLRERRVKLR